MGTCERCLSGRHVGCRGCSCSLCGRQLRDPRPAVTRARRTTQRVERVRRDTVGRPPATVIVPGPMQAAVRAALEAGVSLSEIARRSGLSRDLVRSLRDRQGPTLHTGPGRAFGPVAPDGKVA